MSRPVRLFCLPHAGAGASAYRDWPARLTPDVEVVPVRLPGRETRRREPLARSVTELVADVVPQLLAVDRPVALFGHSMGALLAYELTHTLCVAGRPPVHLFVSGQQAAHRRVPGDDVHTLADDDLADHVAELSGTPRAVLDHPGMIDYLLPILRADFAVCETYEHTPRPPLDVPITALGGSDDEIFAGGGLTAWRELTTAATTLRQFSGGHFYLHDHLDDVIATVHTALYGEHHDHSTKSLRRDA
jgi:surfactin synthase thioesterase subunit